MSERRAFLKFLASSPLLAGYPAAELFAQDGQLAKAGDGLDVFDFEAMAKRVLPPAHWGYLSTGVDGDITLKANSAAYSRYQLRTRRFVDVSRIDMTMQLFGESFNSPIALSPLSSQGAFHPEGEVASARAAKNRGHLQLLSTQATRSVEDVNKARGKPVWFQLYTSDSFAVTTKLLQRAEGAGCPVVAITIDLPAGRNTVTQGRFQKQDTRDCVSCHGPGGPSGNGNVVATKPMFAGIETKGVRMQSASLTWDFIKRVRDVTKMKIMIKGLESGEDAALAVENGADGIVVSNHGGRATETGRATLESLPEVVRAVAGRIPVLVDGGVRRGTDVFKALALGANAVCIGRPYIWGLASFGEQGVDRVLEILNTELRLAMAGCGARSLAEIKAASLIDTRAG
ncbi:MAG: alpha-hydroxy acid oxidase [Steroidobacteraceae bacterium]